jgi:RluA family pseudouridine synthase
MHPCGRFNRNTLTSILASVYDPYNPRPVHRLDANTSGIVLFARTRHFAHQLQRQFEKGNVTKRYLARVHGHPTLDEFHSNAPISDEVGELGSYRVDWKEGKPASTLFRVLERSADGTSLIEATPITGRTNQIRIHLWDLKHSIVGDPTYLPGKKLGDTQTIAPDAPPLNLLAWKLSFVHPIAREPVTYEAERPEWAKPRN